MPSIDHVNKEVLFKIVYYGPGLGGKTTNLEYIYETAEPERCGTMLTLCSESERTLFFDLLPVGLGTYKHYDVRLHLCTVPGQVFQDSSRRLVLTGVDGVVFVADSQEAMLDSNLESLDNLKENLTKHGLDADNTPTVIQFNKRDLDSALDIPQLRTLLGIDLGLPQVEACARDGIGVLETLKAIVRLCMSTLDEPSARDAGRTPSVLPKRRSAARGLRPRMDSASAMGH
jgi:signal recognition particle receptor subunit beta